MPVTLPPASKAVRQALYQALNVEALTGKPPAVPRQLLANGSASIIHSTAPSGTAFPYVIYYKQSGVSNAQAFSAFGRPADSQLWTVKGIVRGSKSGPAEDIDRAIRELLDDATLTISGGQTFDVARASDLDYTELDGDTQYRHHGGIYRVVVTG
jgi:hypothetical protein